MKNNKNDGETRQMLEGRTNGAENSQENMATEAQAGMDESNVRQINEEQIGGVYEVKSGYKGEKKCYRQKKGVRGRQVE